MLFTAKRAVCGVLLIGFGMVLARAVQAAALGAQAIVHSFHHSHAVMTEHQSPASLTLDEAVERAASDEGVDPLILRVILQKESLNGNPRALYRFEPGLYSRLKASRAYRHLSDSEVRMLASSHGPFHILGATGESQCNAHFSSLYNNTTAARCAARLVRQIRDSTPGEDADRKAREIFRRYNGTGRAADLYAQDAMQKLAALIDQKKRA